MCELLGMSANVPTDICFSLAGLVRRGGATGPHRDGWGIAFYEGRGCRAFHDPGASAGSDIAGFLRHYAIRSQIVISHIRRANRGRVALCNTHPFVRELWGRYWTFAHNGELRGIKRWPLHHYRPVGTTDSEHAFCWLLDCVRERFPRRPRRPLTLWRFLRARGAELAELGICNLLLSDSNYLYTQCSTELHAITRRAPFGAARLVDLDFEVDFRELTRPSDVVTVVATRPLTDNETWSRIVPGGFRVYADGEQVADWA